MDRRKDAIHIVFLLMFLFSSFCFPPFVSFLPADEGVSQKYPPHNRKVFVSRLPLSSCGKCEVITTVSTHPSPHAVEAYKQLADRGRAAGADAVFGAKRKIQASQGQKSFTGYGVAVRILDPSAVDFNEENGRWF